MKHILSAITILFIVLTSSVSWSESISIDDLVYRNNLFYKKFTNDPFTGEIFGIENGNIKEGKKNGEWLTYHENGQLRSKKITKTDDLMVFGNSIIKTVLWIELELTKTV